MRLRVPRYDQRLFTCGNEPEVGTRLVADVSDMNRPVLGRLYDDACDVGLEVRTAKGNVVAYHLVKEEHDAEGELVASVLRPTPESIRKTPACAGSEVHLLND